MSSACHFTCKTCSSTLFTGCLTCQNTMQLFENSCVCLTNWQTQCIKQADFREFYMFMDMFFALMLIGVMVMYTLRARLPITYRIWSGLNSLSLIIYSPALYLQYQDFFSLKSLGHSNGPYLSLHRSTQISKQVSIFPTMVVGICLIAMLFFFYPAYSIFINQHENFVEYLKQSGFKYFDTFYFLCSRMMFMCIGKAVMEVVGGGQDLIVPVVILAVYGIVCILGIIRTMILYHRDNSPSQIYSAPFYLYSILSPIAMIGICLVSDSVLLLIVYCSPIALLLLILLLNRGMKILTKTNITLFVTQIIMIGLSVGYIMVDGTIKSYLMIGIFALSVVIILMEVLKLYYNGVDINGLKVHPGDVPSYQKQKKKQIYGYKNNETRSIADSKQEYKGKNYI